MPKKKFNENSPVMTPTEIAQLLGGRLGRNAVYEAIKRNDIPGVVHIGDRIFINRKRFMEWLEGDCQPVGAR